MGLHVQTMPLLTDLAPPPSYPVHPTFSGHETFAFRYAWLKKGVDGLEKFPDLFLRDEAMAELGVGKNMVYSIRHWCLATGVAQEDEAAPKSRARGFVPTETGRALFLNPAWDPFLEDDSSLWLLHWNLATNSAKATTWYWAFNDLNEQEFSRDSLAGSLEHFARKTWSQSSIASSSLKADVSCFLRTYLAVKRGPTSTLEETLDCPLTTLGLISQVGASDRYRFNNGEKPGLTTAVFCYALLDCWRHRHSGQETLSFREIVHGEASPGRIFRLDEDAVLAYLDELDPLTHGKLVFNDTAMVRQVARRAPITGHNILDAYYNLGS